MDLDIDCISDDDYCDVTPDISYAGAFEDVEARCGHPAEPIRELVSNAIDSKSTDTNIYVFNADSCIALAIIDNGTGMSKENGKFNKLTSLNKKTKDPKFGTGMFGTGFKLVMALADLGMIVASRTGTMQSEHFYVLNSPKVASICRNDNHVERRMRAPNESIHALKTQVKAMLTAHVNLDSFRSIYDAMMQNISNISSTSGTVVLFLSQNLDLQNILTLTKWKTPATHSRLIKHDIERTKLISYLKTHSRFGSIYTNIDMYPGLKQSLLAAGHRECDRDYSDRFDLTNLRIFTSEFYDGKDGILIPPGFPHIQEKHAAPPKISQNINTDQAYRDWTWCYSNNFFIKKWNQEKGLITFVLNMSCTKYRLQDWEFMTRGCGNGTSHRAGIKQSELNGLILCRSGTIVQAIDPNDAGALVDSLPEKELKLYDKNLYKTCFAASGGVKFPVSLYIDADFELEDTRNRVTAKTFTKMKDFRFQEALAQALNYFLNKSDTDENCRALRLMMEAIADGQQSMKSKDEEEERKRRLTNCLKSQTISFVLKDDAPTILHQSHIMNVRKYFTFDNEQQLRMLYDKYEEVVNNLIHVRASDDDTMREWRKLWPEQIFCPQKGEDVLFWDSADRRPFSLTRPRVADFSPHVSNAEFKNKLSSQYDHFFSLTEVIFVASLECVTFGEITDKDGQIGEVVKFVSNGIESKCCACITKIRKNGIFKKNKYNTEDKTIKIIGILESIKCTFAPFCADICVETSELVSDNEHDTRSRKKAKASTDNQRSILSFFK